MTNTTQPDSSATSGVMDKLHARIKEMQEAAYTYGEYSQDAVRTALDGVLDVLEELLPAKLVCNPSPRSWVSDQFAPQAATTEQAGQWVRCTPNLILAGVDCAKTPRRDGDGTYSHDHFISHASPAATTASASERDEKITKLIAEIREAKSLARRDFLFDQIIDVWESAPSREAAPVDKAADDAMWNLLEFYQHDAKGRAVIEECREAVRAALAGREAAPLDERGLFEEWAKRKGHDVVSRLETGGKFYVSSFTRHAWDIWQARAALAQPAAPVVDGELPPLSDEQIVQLFNRVQGRWSNFGGPLNAVLKFAREIEVACVASARRAPVGVPYGYAVEAADGHVTFFKTDPTGFRGKPYGHDQTWASLGVKVHDLYAAPSHPEPAGGREQGPKTAETRMDTGFGAGREQAEPAGGKEGA
jgi:hypothetical protein